MTAPPDTTPPEQRLARAVTMLTERHDVVHKIRVAGGGRKQVTISVGPLIDMLRNAGTSSGGAHSIGGSQDSRNMVDEDAVRKLHQLRTDVRWLWETYLPGSTTTLSLFRLPTRLETAYSLWHDLFTRYREAGLVDWVELDEVTELATGWVHLIEAKFNPVETRSFRHACPICGERWAMIGEGVLLTRVDAISITFPGTVEGTFATCRACTPTTVWRGRSQLERLNRGLPPLRVDTEMVVNHNI